MKRWNRPFASNYQAELAAIIAGKLPNKQALQCFGRILTSLAHDEGKCVIIATHSKRVASIADEIWGINDGRMLFINYSY
jgi:ABC-type lipoprotein export system ATPase subunit